MELRIKEITFPEVIDFNFEELKQEISSRVEMYRNLVYTDDQVKQAKADRANLNKFVKALSDERIKIKKQCLQAYEPFEAKVNELSKIVQEPIALIDAQIKDYEEKQKQEKLEKIKAYWHEVLAADKVPEAVTFNQIFNEKWLNASVSMKSVQDEINSRLEQVEKDLATLADLPEFGFEAAEVYKTTLDLNKAISEAKRMAEIAKAKAAREAEQARLAAEAEAKKAEATSPALEERAATEEVVVPPATPTKEWVIFKCLLTIEDAQALGQFFRSREIAFEQV